MEVSIEPGDPPRLGQPVVLFDLAPSPFPTYVVSPDGDRFVSTEPVSDDPEDAPRPALKLVQNWIREFEN